MSLMPFTEPEHVLMLLEGTKQQTTRLPRKRPIKIGETLYCYYKPRRPKSCENCTNYNHEDRGCVEGVLCSYWNKYFGEATVTRIWHHYDRQSWKEEGLFEHYGVRFCELFTDEEGKSILERWAERDGFISFKHANMWFIEHHGTDWMHKDLDVITFEPKWLARKVA